MTIQAKETDAEKKLGFIEEMTTDVDAVQERVQQEILTRNGEAEYLANKCGLAGATDRAGFRAKVPMVEYEDLEPYIRRIANGDRSPILTGPEHPVTELFTSSGTSGGERKLIPSVEDERERRRLLESLTMPVVSQYVPAGLDKGKGLYFHFVRSETKTPGGLPARPVLTSLFKNQRFRELLTSCNTSPAAVVLCEDAFQSMYEQMLCGLCQRHRVVRIGTTFASAVLRAITFFLHNWQQLAADIEAGELSDRITDPSVREAVVGILQRPDPELAQFVRANGDDAAGIVTRIWPNTKYLDTIVTGSMAQYVPALNYYSGGLPIVSRIYASSECSFGINLRPMCDPAKVSYTIMPNMAYFEFLPVEEDAGGDTTASQLVELAHVEVGREYEMVVTTYAGLCRYRVGDVLRVTGFHNAAPEFRFARRQNVLLSVDADKTDEVELQRAVDRASSVLLLQTRGGVNVLDYTSRTCTETIPGHYVIYWEFLAAADGSAQNHVHGVLERCCLEMEEALNWVYREGRVAHGSIGPLEIRVVRMGTFEELADLAVSRGVSVAQYTVPRCVTAPVMIHLLDSHVISNHFSPAMPHWAPDQRFQ